MMHDAQRRFARAVLLFLAAFLILGCDMKTKPIDVGPPIPRPRMGLKIKVVEGEHFMKEPLLDKYERALYVMEVKPGSPAEEAGVQPGDLLLKIDGVDVHGMQDSVALMRRKRPGDSLILDIFRQKETLQLGLDLAP